MEHIHHRSTMHNVVQFITQLKKENKITREILEEFDRTPFKTFLKAIYEGKLEFTQHKPNLEISRIARCFNKETCLFDFNNEVSLGITNKDVAVLFGFPLEPMETTGKKKKKRSDPLLNGVKNKYFDGKQTISYQDIIKIIKVLVEHHKYYTTDMVKEITILIIVALCASLFFPNCSGAMNRSYFDDIEHRMLSTDWPQLILDVLIKSLKKGESKKGLCGCAMLLLYWFGMRINADPKRTRENFNPRVARWVLADLAARIKQSTFDDLKKEEVFEEMTNVSEAEKDFLHQENNLIQFFEDEARRKETYLNIVKEKKLQISEEEKLAEEELAHAYFVANNQKKLQKGKEEKKSEPTRKDETLVATSVQGEQPSIVVEEITMIRQGLQQQKFVSKPRRIQIASSEDSASSEDNEENSSFSLNITQELAKEVEEENPSFSQKITQELAREPSPHSSIAKHVNDAHKKRTRKLNLRKSHVYRENNKSSRN